jgi:IclR family pca regulon transcriptional regulator
MTTRARGLKQAMTAMTATTPVTNEGENERAQDFVTALARGLDVLSCFNADHRRMTLTQVAARTGLTRGTSRRFLLTLEKLGYLTSDGKQFSLTTKVLVLANAYLTSFGLGEPAKQILKRVAQEVGESCSMAVLEGSQIVYVGRADAPRSFATALNLSIGSRIPAHASSLGRVLLAGLDKAELDDWLARNPLFSITERTITDPAKWLAAISEVRQQGYAIINGEMEIGLRSICVPVVNRDGRTIAALNVATLTARTSLEELRKNFLPVMRIAAAEIARVLEHH